VLSVLIFQGSVHFFSGKVELVIYYL
jgi:hypothetical protein